MIELKPDERFLLIWLGEADLSQYGECFGPALDRLIELELAQVHNEVSGFDSGFIARGSGLDFDYRAVSLTEKGWQLRSTFNERA